MGLLRCREEPPKLLQGTRFQERTFQIKERKLLLLKDKKVGGFLLVPLAKDPPPPPPPAEAPVAVLQSIKPEKEWPLKSMKIYIGIRRKLKAPTR